jgi:hypothetical protein
MRSDAVSIEGRSRAGLFQTCQIIGRSEADLPYDARARSAYSDVPLRVNEINREVVDAE